MRDTDSNEVAGSDNDVGRAEVGPRVESQESSTIRSDDGRAEMVIDSRDAAASELCLFRTQRSDDGLRSAHDLMDTAERDRVMPPPELSPSVGAHPEHVDLLRDEPASIGFWRTRADTRVDVTDGASDKPIRSGSDEVRYAMEVKDRMAEAAERRPEVPPFEPPEQWIRDINGDGPGPGRTSNCVFCGIATEQRWRGTQTEAGTWPLDGGLHEDAVEAVVGPLAKTSRSEIEHTLHDTGPGSSGLVAIDWPNGNGHMINVVNDDGRIRWLDGQHATIDTAPPASAVGFHWSASDSEGRPL